MAKLISPMSLFRVGVGWREVDAGGYRWVKMLEGRAADDEAKSCLQNEVQGTGALWWYRRVDSGRRASYPLEPGAQ